MTSKFSLRSLFPLLFILLLTFGIIVYMLEQAKNAPLNGLPLILLLTFTLTWLFHGEFRTKMIKIEIGNDFLIVKKFGGLSPGKKFSFYEIDGFKTSILPSRGGDYEYLYLMQGDRKIAKISNFYHKNYDSLKEALKGKVKDLGFEKFRYLDEFKEIFT